MNPLVVVCDPGLESLQAEELRALGYGASVLRSGNVLAKRNDDGDIAHLNFHLRQATRILLALWIGEAGTLDRIRAVADEIDYAPYLRTDQTFAIVSRRKGDHPFGSPDIAREVGSAVTEQFRRRFGVRIRANLDAPDVSIHAELIDDELLIGVDTTGDSMVGRHPRPYRHPASLRPTLAASLLRLSSFGWEDGGLLDPLAGGGTIPAEAAMNRRGVPAGWFRESFAYERLASVSAPPLNGMKEDARASMRLCDGEIGACDRSAKALIGMRVNFIAQGVENAIRVWEDDASILKGVSAGTHRLLVTNPPFGIRVGSTRAAKALYETLPRVARDKGIEAVAAIAPNDDWLIDPLERAGFEATRRIPFMHGDLPNVMFIAETADRRARRQTHDS